MSNFDQVISALRASGTEPELSRMHDDVDQILGAMSATTDNRRRSSRRKRQVGGLVFGSLVGFGGVAAAGSAGIQVPYFSDTREHSTTQPLRLIGLSDLPEHQRFSVASPANTNSIEPTGEPKTPAPDAVSTTLAGSPNSESDSAGPISLDELDDATDCKSPAVTAPSVTSSSLVDHQEADCSQDEPAPRADDGAPRGNNGNNPSEEPNGQNNSQNNSSGPPEEPGNNNNNDNRGGPPEEPGNNNNGNNPGGPPEEPATNNPGG
ncbi:MAG: hypothetical protein ACJAR2_004091, partial [Ilumatobacter sp.]